MKTLHATSLILAIVFYTSCAFLPPSGPTVPLFKEKGEAMVSASLIGAPESGGIDIKGAIATGDRFYLGGSGTVTRDEGGAKGFMSELAVGTYGRMGENGIYDVSGGLGYGSQYGDRFTKFYVQPAFGFRASKVEFASGIKGSYVISTPDIVYWELYGKNPKDLIVEPFMLGRFGGEKTKFQMGFNFPIPVALDNYATPEWSITLGVVFRLGKK